MWQGNLPVSSCLGQAPKVCWLVQYSLQGADWARHTGRSGKFADQIPPEETRFNQHEKQPFAIFSFLPNVTNESNFGVNLVHQDWQNLKVPPQSHGQGPCAGAHPMIVFLQAPTQQDPSWPNSRRIELTMIPIPSKVKGCWGCRYWCLVRHQNGP